MHVGGALPHCRRRRSASERNAISARVRCASDVSVRGRPGQTGQLAASWLARAAWQRVVSAARDACARKLEEHAEARPSLSTRPVSRAPEPLAGHTCQRHKTRAPPPPPPTLGRRWPARAWPAMHEWPTAAPVAVPLQPPALSQDPPGSAPCSNLSHIHWRCHLSRPPQDWAALHWRAPRATSNEITKVTRRGRARAGEFYEPARGRAWRGRRKLARRRSASTSIIPHPRQIPIQELEAETVASQPADQQKSGRLGACLRPSVGREQDVARPLDSATWVSSRREHQMCLWLPSKTGLSPCASGAAWRVRLIWAADFHGPLSVGQVAGRLFGRLAARMLSIARATCSGQFVGQTLFLLPLARLLAPLPSCSSPLLSARPPSGPTGLPPEACKPPRRPELLLPFSGRPSGSDHAQFAKLGRPLLARSLPFK